MTPQSLSRRALLRTTALIPVAAVFGCGALQSLPQYAQDVDNIATALGNFSSTVSTIVGIPAAVSAKVQGWITDAETLAGKVVSAATTAAGTVATDISSFASTVTNIASTLGLPATSGSTLGVILQAAVSALPTILKLAGVAATIALAPPPGLKPMEYAQASAVLATLAKQKP